MPSSAGKKKVDVIPQIERNASRPRFRVTLRVSPSVTAPFFFNDTATTEIYTLSLHDALPIRPSSSLYSNLGTVLFAQGLYGPAAGAFERALAMGGAANNPLYWGNLADAYRQLPDAADKAREAYDHAIRLLDAELARSPQDLTLRSRRVLYLAKRGDCSRAGDGLASMIDARDAPAYAVFRMAV